MILGLAGKPADVFCQAGIQATDHGQIVGAEGFEQEEEPEAEQQEEATGDDKQDTLIRMPEDAWELSNCTLLAYLGKDTLARMPEDAWESSEC